jgi:hypothetical protein
LWQADRKDGGYAKSMLSVATDAGVVCDLADYDTSSGVDFDPKGIVTGEGIAS